jgi:hypothetical protein
MCRVALLESFAARVIRSRRDLVQASVILQIRDPSGNAAALWLGRFSFTSIAC